MSPQNTRQTIFSQVFLQGQRLCAFAVTLMTFSLLATSFSGCGGGGGGWKMPPPVVGTIQVQARPWTVTYTTTGQLEALNRVDLNSETSGTIAAILVQEGQMVHAGQVLIRLKADKQAAQSAQAAAGVQVAEESLGASQTQVQEAEARLRSAAQRKLLAESEFHRFERLYNEQFISQLELEQRRTTYDTAVSAWQEAQQSVLEARARLKQMSSQIQQAASAYRYSRAVAEDTVIRAPYAGVIGKKYVDVGDFVAPTEKLMTIVDNGRYRIQFAVPERYLSVLKPGMTVAVSFEGVSAETTPNASISGIVDFVDPVVDPQAHTVTVKALLPQSSQLKDGLFGNVALALASLPNALVLPEEVLVPQGEKTFVYVVKQEVYHPTEVPQEEGKKAEASKAPSADAAGKSDIGKIEPVVHIQEVHVVHREKGFVQIDSGVALGDEIVSSGLQKIHDNQQVVLQRLMPKEAAETSPQSKAGH